MTPDSDRPLVLVTGANGFVGRRLCPALDSAGYAVRRITRREDGAGDTLALGDLSDTTDWTAALAGVEYIVHLAARVHVMQETNSDPLAAFRAVNVAVTESLARQAAQAGVKRLVFVSTVKVNGEATLPGRPFSEADAPRPEDPYGLSKWEAEQVLAQVSADSGLDYCVLRPPLIYGPGVKGNFLTMLRWVDRGLPLPLAMTRNRRSLLALGNLVDFIIHSLDHPNASNQTLLLSDGEDLSTAALIRRLAQSLDTQARLLPVPEALLRLPARVLGREAMVERLFGSLQLDSAKAQSLLNWQPPVSVDAGLRETARWYRQDSG